MEEDVRYVLNIVQSISCSLRMAGDVLFAMITWGVGDLIYLQIFGKPMMLINSAKVAHDLLEKRSSNYSDRWFLFFSPVSLAVDFSSFSQDHGFP